MSENLENEQLEENKEENERPELSKSEKLGLLEALLFACGEPLTQDLILHVTRFSEEEFKEIITELKEKLLNDERGIELVTIASKYQLRTKSLFAPYLKELKAGGPRKLTAAALETLSIVAYRQPIVKSDIEKIRGVDATPTLKTLIDRNLIRIIGHQATVGQPALYATTDDFLSIFGLNALEDLPTLREINEIEKDPGEVEETEGEDTENEASQAAEVSI
jgi:segregation and condensation protein B